MATTPHQHLTVAELAERERVPMATVYRWNHQGNGPRFMRLGRHVRYRLADVLAWEEANASTPRPAA